MSVRETALLLPCQGERLLAVVSEPATAAPPRDTGVVIVVGGPQYRVGSHRQFVSLARTLAADGWPGLRFDVRGMGDSTGTLHDFLDATPDIAAAVDALCQQTSVQRVMLWGLCDGASAALLYLHERADPRVAGLCLVNPWVRSAQSLARTHVRHYYRQRLLEPSFWLKLLRGGVALQALRSLLGNVRDASGGASAGPLGFQDRMAAAWRAFRGPVQLVLSGNDLTAREFLEYTAASPAWQGLCTRPTVSRLDLPQADHTFSASEDQRQLEQAVRAWWRQSEGLPA